MCLPLSAALNGLGRCRQLHCLPSSAGQSHVVRFHVAALEDRRFSILCRHRDDYREDISLFVSINS